MTIRMSLRHEIEATLSIWPMRRNGCELASIVPPTVRRSRVPRFRRGNIFRRARMYFAFLAALVFTDFSPVPACAAGFWEDMFGLPASPRAEPSINPRSRGEWRSRDRRAEHNRVKQAARTAPAPAPPVAPRATAQPPHECCKTFAEAIAAVRHDATLRRGDAYMTPDGLRIFVGEEGDEHDENDFAVISNVRGVSKREIERLRALDTAFQKRAGPTKIRHSPPVIMVRRPSNEQPERRIVDSRGHAVRIVGPSFESM